MENQNNQQGLALHNPEPVKQDSNQPNNQMYYQNQQQQQGQQYQQQPQQYQNQQYQQPQQGYPQNQPVQGQVIYVQQVNQQIMPQHQQDYEAKLNYYYRRNECLITTSLILIILCFAGIIYRILTGSFGLIVYDILSAFIWFFFRKHCLIVKTAIEQKQYVGFYHSIIEIRKGINLQYTQMIILFINLIIWIIVISSLDEDDKILEYKEDGDVKYVEKDVLYIFLIIEFVINMGFALAFNFFFRSRRNATLDFFNKAKEMQFITPDQLILLQQQYPKEIIQNQQQQQMQQPQQPIQP